MAKEALSSRKVQRVQTNHALRLQTCAQAYWGIGLYWGKAGSNNKKGHMIGHIKDIGGDPSDPNTRLYTTHAAQPWHNDISDLVCE